MPCFQLFLPSAATYDVQDPMVESVAKNKISISLDFIEESSALGCFVVIEDHFATSEDTFLVMKRYAMDSTISQNISVSASTYTVYFYDLEDNALPNAHPAVSTLQVISVNGLSKCRVFIEFTPVITIAILFYLAFSKGKQPVINGTKNSIFEISESGSNVTIDCFAECSSYLVVYRAYGDPTLNLIHNTTFPVTITLEIGTYTFAVFGIIQNSAKRNDIYEIPLLRKVVRVIPEDIIESSKTFTSTVMISVPTPTLNQPKIKGKNCPFFFH